MIYFAIIMGSTIWLHNLLGDTNAVPVDFVAGAMDVLMHKPELDGRAFHLVSPQPQSLLSVVNAFMRSID